MFETSVDRQVHINAEDVLAKHRERMKAAGDLAFAISQEEAPQDRGQLQQTMFPPEFRGDDLVWGATQPYAEAMEKGTPPFVPPAAPLVAWAERQGLDPEVGYMVQAKIAREGITPHPFLEPGAERARQYLDSHGLDL